MWHCSREVLLGGCASACATVNQEKGILLCALLLKLLWICVLKCTLFLTFSRSWASCWRLLEMFGKAVLATWLQYGFWLLCYCIAHGLCIHVVLVANNFSISIANPSQLWNERESCLLRSLSLHLMRNILWAAFPFNICPILERNFATTNAHLSAPCWVPPDPLEDLPRTTDFLIEIIHLFWRSHSSSWNLCGFATGHS